MCYYVFWIPSLSGKLELKNTDMMVNISDTDVFEVSAHIDKKSREVILSYQYKDTEYEISLTPFKDIDRCFLYYKLDEIKEKESPISRDLLEKFPNWLYHIFKQFYHNHKFHSEEEDSILNTRFFNSYAEYSNTEMSDREFYLNEYEERFRGILTRICDNLTQIDIRRSKGEYRNYLKIYKGYKKLLDIFLQYEGEYSYYKALKASLPNSKTDIAKETIRRIEYIDTEIRIRKEMINNQFSVDSAIIGTNISTAGTVFGVVGVVLSVIAMCQTCASTTDEKIQQVENEVASVKADVKDIDSLSWCTRELYYRIDSLQTETVRKINLVLKGK